MVDTFEGVVLVLYAVDVVFLKQKDPLSRATVFGVLTEGDDEQKAFSI